MKNLLIGLLFLGSLSLKADLVNFNVDEQSLKTLTVGTTLKLINDIGIPPYSNNKIFGRYKTENFSMECSVQVGSIYLDQSTPYPRVIPAGTLYKVKGVKYDTYDPIFGYMLVFDIIVDSESISFRCTYDSNISYEYATIGTFKLTSQQHLIVEPAEPMIIR